MVISLIGLIVTIVPIFVFVFLSDFGSSPGSDAKTYGQVKNEISFEKGNVSINEIDEIAQALKTVTFFDEQDTKYVYVNKIDKAYEIPIPVVEEVRNNPETSEPYEGLQNDLQTAFPDNKIVLRLVGGDLEDVIKRIE